MAQHKVQSDVRLTMKTEVELLQNIALEYEVHKTRENAIWPLSSSVVTGESIYVYPDTNYHCFRYVCHLFAVALGDKSAQMLHMKHQKKGSRQKKWFLALHANCRVESSENVHHRRKCSVFSWSKHLFVDVCGWKAKTCVDITRFLKKKMPKYM